MNNYLDNEISFREFALNYVPKYWVEPLRNIMCIPYWNKKEYEEMKKGIFDNLVEYKFINKELKLFDESKEKKKLYKEIMDNWKIKLNIK